MRVEFLRGGHREAVHPFSAVVVKDGREVLRLGDEVSTYWRSACKPFQLSVSLSCLPPEVVRALSDEELALGAASHSGQPAHVAKVRELLTRFGLDEDALQCGAHPPVHEASARAVETPGNVHNNCSGKHTFMLAACAAQGWARDYRPVEHPLQAKNRALLDELGGTTHQVGVDGCSIPTFFAPLSSMARSWSRLAEEMQGGSSTLGRIGRAMQRAPFFVSGDERLDLRVTTQASEPLAVKVGAEGLFCIARPATGEGFAVKVHTGNADALAVAVKHVLREAGLAFTEPWPWETVLNVRKREVGARVVTSGGAA